MKFGFNYMTDEAREKLQELGVTFRKEGSLWCVYTDYVDLLEQDLRDRWIEQVDNADIPRMVKEQTVRLWKHPDTGEYYFMLNNEHIFVKSSRYKTDRSTNPPTQYEFSLFDYPEDQESFRDLLLNRPPAAKGVLM